MNIVIFLLIFFWGVRIVRNIFSYAHLWYIKEYRFDRMLIHVRSEPLRRIFFPGFRLPPRTPKAILVVGITALVLAVFLVGSPFFIFFSFLVADLLTLGVTGFSVFFLKLPTILYHELIIALAVGKLRGSPALTVIGITGSYGKTSTKELLFTLLRRRFKTLKTEASKNSPIAIAELVLGKLEADHEVLIVEMAAYKRGEIARMCRMVRPQIGIVTAINAQHQDLFGSIENTVEAKYELIAGLVGKRLAITNGDNPFVARMASRAKGEGISVIEYTVEGKTNAQYAVRDIASEGLGIRFALMHEGVRTPFAVRLIGVHQAANVLAAAAVAHELGLTWRQIQAAAKEIQPFQQTMYPRPGVNGSRFIDDTFNNNPDAALAALQYLASTSGAKILVFQPMIELGKFARESHERVAREAGRICNAIFLTNDRFRDVFERNRNDAAVFVSSARDAAESIRKMVRKGDTVIFKGKESSRVLQLLI